MDELVTEAFPNLKCLSKSVGSSKYNFYCSDCNYTFSVGKPSALKLGCPACSELWRTAPPRTRPHLGSEDYLKQLKTTPYTLLSTFKGLTKKHKFRCAKHRVSFLSSAKSVLTRDSCPECKRDKCKTRILPRDVCENRIKEIHGNSIKLLGDYAGTQGNRKYRFKCYTCFNTWKAQIHGIFSGRGCPVCSKRKQLKSFKIKEFDIDGHHLRLQGYEYQAVLWLREHSKIQIPDIVFDSSGETPVIQYKYGKRWRRYYPDMYVPKFNGIIEVKSTYTLGLLEHSSRGLKQTQAKAKACLEDGYKFALLLMSETGTRYKLPPNWFLMSKLDILSWCAYQNGDLIQEDATPPISLSKPYRKHDNSRRRYRSAK